MWAWSRACHDVRVFYYYYYFYRSYFATTALHGKWTEKENRSDEVVNPVIYNFSRSWDLHIGGGSWGAEAGGMGASAPHFFVWGHSPRPTFVK